MSGRYGCGKEGKKGIMEGRGGGVLLNPLPLLWRYCVMPRKRFGCSL